MTAESPKFPVITTPDSSNGLNNMAFDLTQFAPMGDGIYGFETSGHNPILEAPRTNAEGGTLYFDNRITKEELLALGNIMGIRTNPNNLRYLIIEQQAETPISDRYLTQWRFISDFANKFLFEDKKPEAVPSQPFSIPEAMWRFIEGEKAKYGTIFGNPAIAGKLGGNGYTLQEQLAFGVTVENPYYGVYRIWSRPWLVGK